LAGAPYSTPGRRPCAISSRPASASRRTAWSNWWIWPGHTLSDENRTITVLPGHSTALYTPLEQYGGDSGLTDVRTDLYALGATLYHLLTNEPPPEAKQRFLTPGVLHDPRDSTHRRVDRARRPVGDVHAPIIVDVWVSQCTVGRGQSEPQQACGART
jgi:serine/threonine protein kinase